jgi:hypothetical protein
MELIAAPPSSRAPASPLIVSVPEAHPARNLYSRVAVLAAVTTWMMLSGYIAPAVLIVLRPTAAMHVVAASWKIAMTIDPDEEAALIVASMRIRCAADFGAMDADRKTPPSDASGGVSSYGIAFAVVATVASVELTT